jgi:hypothetical protein
VIGAHRGRCPFCGQIVDISKHRQCER